MSLYGTLQNPALVQALSHPLRVKMLNVLQQRAASPKELAAEFGVPLANVAYHIQVLRKLKIIRLVKKTPRRGAVEHHYKADHGTFVDDSAWGQTPAIVQDAAVAAMLDEVGTAATEAASIGGFNHPDAHLTRLSLVLDQQAWEELAGMLLDVFERAQRLEQEATKRLRKSDHEGERRTGLALMQYESAPAVPNADDALNAGPAPADPHADPRVAELSE